MDAEHSIRAVRCQDSNSRYWLGLAMLFVVAGGPRMSLAQDPVIPLLGRIPETANTIAVVRVQELLRSPRGIREKWSDLAGNNPLFGDNAIPPWVDTLVVGSHVRVGEFSKTWSVGVLSVPPLFSLEGLARRENANVEDLGGFRAVRGRRDAFFVDLGERVLGVMSPAYRQDVARWARRAVTGKTAVSDYLNMAATTSAQILVALDVQDAYDPIRAREHLNQQPILADAKIPVIDVLEHVREMRGIRFLAIAQETTEAKIVLDFNTPVKLPPDVLKALTISAINDQGMYLPELESAKAIVTGKTFVLSVDQFSDESLRSVLSLIITTPPEQPSKMADVSVAELSNAKDLTSPPRGGERGSAIIPDRDATSRYLSSVNRIVMDLDRNLNRANDYLRTATWHDNFAAKIDRLPASGVASEVLEYGQRMSSRLRALAVSLRGVAVKVNVQEGTIVYNSFVNPSYEYYGLWGFGYQPANVNVTSNLQAVRERQASAILEGAEERTAIWQMIRDDMNAMIRPNSGAPVPAPAVEK